MRTWIYLLIAIMALGCEAIFLKPELEETPSETFDYLWNQIHDRYSFFDIKDVDWDQVRVEYDQRIDDDMNQVELFDALFDMLVELEDGHVNLVSPFNVSRYEFDLTRPENFDDRLIRESYLGPKGFTTGPFRHNIVRNNIGYVRYSSFSGSVSNTSMDLLLSFYREADGMILDLRSNGGGSADNIFRIMDRFTEEEVLLYRSQTKNGSGDNDFSELTEAYAQAEEDAITFLKPVVVLVNRSSFSATSFFALGAQSMPNMTVMGDTTGGGLGAPNGGQLPNGWTYRFSVSRTLSPTGENYENGMPPDIRVDLAPLDAARGFDTMIERAIEELSQ
ncbi:S41 family peptidase [Pontibacter sp. G13]|uniref:S41 family peptidase n=1 Tax=Pontibacter sp. G13 TaxID=3074898 RepID=UPI0028891368|nr:S41 family peptidase [Pontibacter sp. G13]WNJ18960.1 S41 family peptidase [Pontibacter sp. G13]